MTSPLVWLDLLAAALLLPMLAVALYNLLTAPRLEAGHPAPALPTVSLLVPARNEAENLRRTLPALLAQEYPRLEILLLDDGSEDDTGAVAQALLGEGGGRLLRGEPLPEGWVGKSWACHQLAARASGEVLIFCDADVTPAVEAVRRTVALLEAEGAHAVTALPRQELRSWGEQALVPLVTQLPVLALLPLRLVPRVASPGLSMANGQWLAVRREAYAASGGHQAVRTEVLEDVALGRRIKAQGLRLVAAVAPTLLSVRMYDGLQAAREGFRKNLYSLLGGHPLAFTVACLLFLLTAVYPWLALLGGRLSAALPLALLLAVRAAGALLFRHGWRSVVLHPLGAVLFLAAAVASGVGHHRRTLRWKGRPLPSAAAPPMHVASTRVRR